MGGHKYKKIRKIGEGTGGVVTEAKDSETGRIVAVKKVRMGTAKDGISVAALREIKLLQEIKHPNVIELVDVYASNTNVNLVFEYCLTDLEHVIKDTKIFLAPAEVKCCMQMILRGVEACHRHWTLHRDLKPNNILVGMDGNLKLADFGLARIHGSPSPRFTYLVVTRWYRAPELLFGARKYGAAVDMWAVGCIFAELMLRVPYLPGDSEIDQLRRIFKARGTPSEEDWPGMDSLPGFVEFPKEPTPDHRLLFSAASEDALDLLNQFLQFDPAKRISASDALRHPYFTKAPLPCSPQDLLQKILQSRTLTESDVLPQNAKQYSTPANQMKTPMSVCRNGETPTSSGGRFNGKRKLEFT